MGAPQYEQAGADIGGTGTTGTIPVWTGPSTLGDSLLSQSGAIVTNATGAIRANGTTQTTPAFMRHDATNSGIYFPATNEIGFTISGSHAMFISTGRNICMGTTTPASANTRLTVAGGFIATAAGFGVYQAGDHLTLSGGAGKNVHLKPNDGGVLAVNVGATSCDMSAVAGYGLKLPATPGNADTQTLDCYAEVAWTPADVSGAGLSITVNRATYTKIGRTVTASFDITYPVTANGTAAQISLPESTGTANLGTLSAPYCSVALAAGLTGIVTNGKIVFYYGFPSANVPNSTFSGARIVASVTFTV